MFEKHLKWDGPGHYVWSFDKWLSWKVGVYHRVESEHISVGQYCPPNGEQRKPALFHSTIITAMARVDNV